MIRNLFVLTLLAAVAACTTAPAPSPAPERFDLVVYGGTAAGVVAAVQGRAMGRTVVLLEPGAHLGGLTSGGLGNTDIGNKGAIGGLSRSFYERVAARYARPEAWKQETRDEYLERSAIGNQGHGREDAVAEETGVDTMWVFEPSVAEGVFRAMAEEAGVDIRFGQRLDLDRGVAMDGPVIRSIRMESGEVYRGRDVHRRHLRGRPDGRRPACPTPSAARRNDRLRRDAQRRPDGSRRQPPVHRGRGSLRRARRPGERPAAGDPRRRPGRGGPGRPPRPGLQLPHVPHRRAREPRAASRKPDGYDPPAYELLRRYFDGRRQIDSLEVQQRDAQPQDRHEQPRRLLAPTTSA